MHTYRPFVLRWLQLAALPVLLAGCRTLDYRHVQSDFDHAVVEEMQRSASPFIDWYRNVSDTLTPEYISKLDPKLRPNAWMLKSVSQWRSSDLTAARGSAKQGLGEANLIQGSRDDVVLTMIPALVVDSELMMDFRQRSGAIPGTNYQSTFGEGFKPQFWSSIRQRQDFERTHPTV